ncbi:MAG: phytoene/squalene synthase family protein [Armatimonadetes bacterium]|nr:phytoene/squalene synthase family protein [Armatimonadota bacterium]
MALSLVDSYDVCRRVVAAAGSSFEAGMKLFPADRRDAVYALYAFFRISDDLVDDGEESMRAAEFGVWQEDVRAALGGAEPNHDCLPAVLDAVRRFELPAAIFTDCLDACAEDLGSVRLADWAAVDRYCDGVAGTVGEACLRILGDSDDQVLGLSKLNARAVQLTNIIRDIDEDLTRDRIYLPTDLLDRHGVSHDDLAAEDRPASLVAALTEAAERAESLYHDAEPLFPLLAARHRPPIVAMTLRYRELLGQLRREGFREKGRASLSGTGKLGVLASVLASPWMPTWRR